MAPGVTLLDRFCDQCGERRIGQFRYCLRCRSDFEGWHDEAAAPEATLSASPVDAPGEPDDAQTTAGHAAQSRASPGERQVEPGASLGGGRRLPVAEAFTAITIGMIALLIVYLATISIQPPA